MYIGHWLSSGQTPYTPLPRIYATVVKQYMYVRSNTFLLNLRVNIFCFKILIFIPVKCKLYEYTSIAAL